MGVFLKNETSTYTPSPINVAANLYERHTNDPVDFEHDPDVQQGRDQVNTEFVGVVAATPNSPMGRDSAGRSKVAPPDASDDIATKGYVDGQINDHDHPQSSITGLVARLESIEQRLTTIETRLDAAGIPPA